MYLKVKKMKLNNRKYEFNFEAYGEKEYLELERMADKLKTSDCDITVRRLSGGELAFLRLDI